jgi:hypothetical protein
MFIGADHGRQRAMEPSPPPAAPPLLTDESGALPRPTA